MVTSRGIIHSHVFWAIRLYDAGESHPFGKSTVHDLLRKRRFQVVTFVIVFLGFALTLTDLPAQTSDTGSKILKQATEQLLAQQQPIPEADRKKVEIAAKFIMDRLVTFKADGLTSTTHQLHGKNIHVEWTELKLGEVKRGTVTDGDKQNGITNRYRVLITSKTSRQWDVANKRWGEWQTMGYVLFPSSIDIVESNGVYRHAMKLHGSFGKGLPASDVIDVSGGESMPTGMRKK
jgi:hypothetical protein